MRRIMSVPIVALVAMMALASCSAKDDTAQAAERAAEAARAAGGGVVAPRASSGRAASPRAVVVERAPDAQLPSGTSIDITLDTGLSSETVTVGTPWSGVLRNAIYAEGRDIASAGSAVGGTVTSVFAAKRGERAALDLGLSWFDGVGRRYSVRGSTPSIIAGSTRARNLGAIAAATAAGAVAGHAIGGSDKGTLIGAVIGAGAAAGVVSQTRGWQVLLKPGMPLTFTTTQTVAVRL